MRSNLVRLSDFEHRQLENARREIMMRGMANLPDVEPLCPQCGNHMDGISINYNSLNCPHCGFADQSVLITATGALALGAIVALGAAALIQLLSQVNNE